MDALMERVLDHTNVQRALKRVRGNKGSPGIDGMTVDELPEWMKDHVRVREEPSRTRTNPTRCAA